MVRNQGNVSEWSYISTCFSKGCWSSTKRIIIISSKSNLLVYLIWLAIPFIKTKYVITHPSQGLSWSWSYIVVGFTANCAIGAYWSVAITTNVASSNPARCDVYSMQYYVKKVVSDLRQVGGSLRLLRLPPPIKLTTTIQLKYRWKWRYSWVGHFRFLVGQLVDIKSDGEGKFSKSEEKMQNRYLSNTKRAGPRVEEQGACTHSLILPPLPIFDKLFSFKKEKRFLPWKQRCSIVQLVKRCKVMLWQKNLLFFLILKTCLSLSDSLLKLTPTFCFLS